MRKLGDGRGITARWPQQRSSITVTISCFCTSNNGQNTGTPTKANGGELTNTGLWTTATAGYSLTSKSPCGITRRPISNGMSKSKERPAPTTEISSIGGNDSANTPSGGASKASSCKSKQE